MCITFGCYPVCLFSFQKKKILNEANELFHCLVSPCGQCARTAKFGNPCHQQNESSTSSRQQVGACAKLVEAGGGRC